MATNWKQLQFIGWELSIRVALCALQTAHGTLHIADAHDTLQGLHTTYGANYTLRWTRQRPLLGFKCILAHWWLRLSCWTAKISKEIETRAFKKLQKCKGEMKLECIRFEQEIGQELRSAVRYVCHHTGPALSFDTGRRDSNIWHRLKWLAVYFRVETNAELMVESQTGQCFHCSPNPPLVCLFPIFCLSLELSAFIPNLSYCLVFTKQLSVSASSHQSW